MSSGSGQQSYAPPFDLNKKKEETEKKNSCTPNSTTEDIKITVLNTLLRTVRMKVDFKIILECQS